MSLRSELLLGIFALAISLGLFYAQYRSDKSPLPIHTTRPFFWAVGYSILALFGLLAVGREVRPIEYFGYPSLLFIITVLPVRLQTFPTLARWDYRFDRHPEWQDALVLICVLVLIGIRVY